MLLELCVHIIHSVLCTEIYIFNFSAVKAGIIYDQLCKIIYAKTPDPTEDVPADFYMNIEAEKVLKSRYIKDKPEVVSYIKRYLDFREVNLNLISSLRIFSIF